MNVRPMMIAALSLVLAACATSLPQTPPAGQSAQVGPPSVQAGATYRYAVRDGFTSIPRGSVEYRVASVTADSMSVEVKTDREQTTETYTRDWNWLVRPATNMQAFVYKPAFPALQFPLTAGKTWSVTATATDPANGRTFPIRVKAEVLGWEKVRVPAGEFDTLKVRRYVYFDYFESGVRGESWSIETDWYAPAIGQVARRETNSKYWRLAGLEPRPLADAGYRFVRAKGDRDGDAFPRFEQDDWLIYELTQHSK